MKKINIILSLIILFFGWGCVMQQEAPTDIADGKYNLALNISRAVESDANFVGQEQTIISARMIVIATSNIPQRGRVTYNHCFDSSELVGTGKDVARAFVRSGQSDVYLIINETAALKADLVKVDNVEQLRAVVCNFPTSPHLVGSLAIPMMQCYPTNIAPYPAVTTVNTTNGVERLWAKVRVRFKATDDPALIAAGYPNMTGMVISKVQLHNVPESSYVIAQNYPSTSTLRADDHAITKDYTLTTTATESADAYYEFYVPEFLGASADRHSFLKVNATTKEGSPRYYILDLKTTVPTQSFNLLRNTFYDITATIRGYGQGDVDVVTNVLPWNKVTSSPEVGEYLKLSNPNIDMLEMDEEMIVSYSGATPTLITFDDVLKDKIETTVTKDAANSGKITFKRKDVVHDGQKHSGVMTIKCSSPVSYSVNVPVSIEQYSVNIGGILTTSADGLKKYWNGGVNWATGNLTIQNPAQNKGMTISTDPYNMQNKDMYFKFQSRVAAYKDFSTTSRLYDGSGTALTRNLWSDVLAVYYNEDPCKNAAQIPGEAGVYGDSNPYWRQPTKAEAEVLVSNIPVNNDRIAIYKSRLGFANTTVLDWNLNGALAMSGSNNWTSSVISTASPDRNAWTAYSFYAGAHVMQVQCVNYGFFVRCVRNNTYHP